MQIRFAWAACAPNDLESIANADALKRLNTSAEAKSHSVLDRQADLHDRVGDIVVRRWTEAQYVLIIAASPCPEPTLTECYGLTGVAVTTISEAIPGDPTVAKVLPEVPALLSAFIISWALFVGIPMFGYWAARPLFDPGTPPPPRFVSVDGAARRLRWRARGRRAGQFALAYGLISTVAVIVIVVRDASISVAATACSTSFVAAGATLTYVCRHPQFSAGWLQYKPQFGRINSKRLASSCLTVILGLLAVAFPLTALATLILLTLVSPDGDGPRIVTALLFAAVAVGYGIDRLARRLRVRTAAEVTEDRKGEGHLLYLRNFGDDEVKVPSSPLSRTGLWQGLTAWANPFRRVRFEELLARLLGRWGPVTGFNDPNLKLATLGTAKTLAPNENWQEVLADEAKKAYAVVVSATPLELRPGLAWELDMLASRLGHGRIVLILGVQPTVAAVTDRFQAFMLAVCRYPLFSPLTTGVPNGTLVLVHVPAHGSGTWYGWTASRRTAWTYAAAIDAAFTFAKLAWTQPVAVRR